MDRPKLQPVSVIKKTGIKPMQLKPDEVTIKAPKPVKKTKRQLKLEKAARIRAQRLKDKDLKDSPSTYNTSTLDPNASVNYNAMSEAMFK